MATCVLDWAAFCLQKQTSMLTYMFLMKTFLRCLQKMMQRECGIQTMLPRERDYFDHQDEHWVNNPFITDRQKIRMFDDMMALSKKVGVIEERKRVLESIQEQIKTCRESNSDLSKDFIAGLQLMEGKINDELRQITGQR